MIVHQVTNSDISDIFSCVYPQGEDNFFELFYAQTVDTKKLKKKLKKAEEKIKECIFLLDAYEEKEKEQEE